MINVIMNVYNGPSTTGLKQQHLNLFVLGLPFKSCYYLYYPRSKTNICMLYGTLSLFSLALLMCHLSLKLNYEKN